MYSVKVSIQLLLICVLCFMFSQHVHHVWQKVKVRNHVSTLPGLKLYQSSRNSYSDY